MASQVVVVENPALHTVLARLRSRETGRGEFCRLMELAGLLLAYEASQSLPRKRVKVETPMNAYAVEEVVDTSRITVVAVLRAALPMLNGVLRVLEGVEAGFVAATRLEEGEKPKGEEAGGPVFPVETPYWKLPRVKDRIVVLVDPMLATGSTLARVASRLSALGAKGIVVLSLIATETGINRVREAAAASTVFYTAAVDPVLDRKGFIVPGLGDAGDRCYGAPETG